MKLTEDERRRIKEHRKVAPPIPQPRKVKSLEGQLEIDFERLSVARQTSRCDERPSSDAEKIARINIVEAISYLDQTAAQTAAGGTA